MGTANKKVILLAGILALITTFTIYSYIKKASVKPDTTVYSNVYVAVKNLPAKHTLTESDIKQVKIAKEYVNSHAVTNKAEIIGMLLKDNVIEGEQILKDRLATDKSASLAYSVPRGKRAVSVNVNEQISVSGMIRPGDHVDIIASFDSEKTGQITYPRITRIVIQNVMVLALGQDMTVTDQKLKDLPKTVTLAVSPEEAEQLVYISEFAVIRIALRAVDDDKKVETSGTEREDIVPQESFAEPVLQDNTNQAVN